VSWETVIGLEVHVQLLTRTKLFCGCSTRFGAAPNTQTCPVCVGMPGTLPVAEEDGRIVLHCLDTQQPVAKQTADHEARLVRALGGNAEDA